MEKLRYFWKNFWPSITLLVAVAIGFFIISQCRFRFRTDKITGFVEKSSYAGNAVFINKRFLIASSEAIDRVCKPTSSQQRLQLFIIKDGQVFRVSVIDRDELYGLALLSVNQSERRFINVNNFVLLPDISGDHYNYLDTDAYISRTINSPQNTMYKKYHIKNIADVGFSTKSKDIIRKNFGEIVLNDRNEFIGLTVGNTAGSFKNILSNEIKIVDIAKIKNFLKRNDVYYYKNVTNIDLRTVANYKKSVGARIICVVQEPPVSKVVKMYRY